MRMNGSECVALQVNDEVYCEKESQAAHAKATASAADIRQGKIDALRSAIAEGRYKVSNEQIAEAIYADLIKSNQY